MRCFLRSSRLAADVALTDGGASSGGAGVLSPLEVRFGVVGTPCFNSSLYVRSTAVLTGLRARGECIFCSLPFPCSREAPVVFEDMVILRACLEGVVDLKQGVEV